MGAVGVSPPEVGVSPSKVGVRPRSESDPGRSWTDCRKNELGRSLIFEGRRVGKSESDSEFSEQLSGSVVVFSYKSDRVGEKSDRVGVPPGRNPLGLELD